MTGASASVVRGLLGAASTAVLVVVTAVPSWAAEPPPSPQDDGDGRLRVAESPTAPYFEDLAPGEPRYWAVTTWVEGEERARLTMRLQASGELVTAPEQGLRVEVRRCASLYDATTDDRVRPSCPGPEEVVVPDQPMLSVAEPTTATVGRTFALPDLVGDRREHLLVTVGLPATAPADAAPATASFGVGLNASGITGTPGPGGGPRDPDVPPAVDGPRTPASVLPPWRLPDTGGPAWWLAVVGVSLAGFGALLVGRRGRHHG